MVSPGQRPRDAHSTDRLALKARVIPAPTGVTLTANRSVESRLRRLVMTRLRSWDGAPGWSEPAPLALNICCEIRTLPDS